MLMQCQHNVGAVACSCSGFKFFEVASADRFGCVLFPLLIFTYSHGAIEAISVIPVYELKQFKASVIDKIR
jgi:hypothetical protein